MRFVRLFIKSEYISQYIKNIPKINIQKLFLKNNDIFIFMNLKFPLCSVIM